MNWKFKTDLKPSLRKDPKLDTEPTRALRKEHATEVKTCEIKAAMLPTTTTYFWTKQLLCDHTTPLLGGSRKCLDQESIFKLISTLKKPNRNNLGKASVLQSYTNPPYRWASPTCVAWATCSWSNDGWLLDDPSCQGESLRRNCAVASMFIGTSLNSQIVKSQQTVRQIFQLIFFHQPPSLSLSLCKALIFFVVTMLPKFHSWHTKTWVVKNFSPLLSSQTPPPWTRTSLPGVQLQPVPNKTKQDTEGRSTNLEIIWNHQTRPSPNFDISDKGISPIAKFHLFYFGYKPPPKKQSPQA